jgi:predicted transcriptional regulator
MPQPISLTELQLDIMRVLWTRGHATVTEVAHGVRARKLAQATVATILTRLEKRGAVTHTIDGRQFVYSALLQEKDVQRSVVSRIKTTLFSGDVPALVNQLLSGRDVSTEDLKQVKELIAAKEKELASHPRTKRKKS